MHQSNFPLPEVETIYCAGNTNIQLTDPVRENRQALFNLLHLL